MTPQTVISLAEQSIGVMLMVAGPLLLVALLVGLLVSVVQAATQINESTLSFSPKLLSILAVLVVAGPWMIQMLVDYIHRLFESIPALIG